MDSVDKAILNEVQGNFPVSSDPYGDVGKKLGISGEEVLTRVKALKQNKIIRKVGPFFDAKKMGHRSTLCAVHVPEEKLRETADIISSYVEVTHNYLREGSPNVWFTLIAENEGEIERILSEISDKAGVGPIRNLPARRMFKIKVDLKLKG
ncbi:MAG: AsnC family transcriptional regulator [Deltaproteobacteria bacterium]|nr:AsnC family transcriptional regulator [Deltaproteobacteria bacterium]